MIPHHQAAVDMARTYLESGNDPALRRIAAHIVAEQQAEISQMKALTQAHLSDKPNAH